MREQYQYRKFVEYVEYVILTQISDHGLPSPFNWSNFVSLKITIYY